MRDQPPVKERLRRQFEHQQRIQAVPEAIFPLLCPVREYDWIPDWHCRLVYTGSGLAEPGCVFQTDRDADGGLDTWVISRHEPNRHIAFVRINRLRAMHYGIHLEPADDRSTILLWTQVVTALTDEGDRHVEALREADFAAVITKLEKLLNDYLAGTSTAQAGG